MTLDILIPTVTERKMQFETLLNRFQELSMDGVNVIYLSDDKTMPIGTKRNKLLEMSSADYIVFFDDDDWPHDIFVSDIMQALVTKPDCVGFEILCMMDGVPKLACHSLKYKEWSGDIDGYDHVRNVTHRNPVKREIALQVKFPDLRFGEDQVYSNGITKLCQNEVFIPKQLFTYIYRTEDFVKKYGFNLDK